MSYGVRGNDVYILLNPSNSNGSALLGVVNNVRATRRNDVSVGNSAVRGVGRGRLSLCEEGRLNCIFRSCGLVPGLAMERGVRINTCLDSGPLGISSLVGALKLCRREGGVPGRLSNNRRREASVNETVIGGPSLLLYSRPANTLSCGASGRVLGLVRSMGGGCNGAIVLIARGSTVGGVTSEIVGLHSNRVERSVIGARGAPTRRLS